MPGLGEEGGDLEEDEDEEDEDFEAGVESESSDGEDEDEEGQPIVVPEDDEEVRGRGCEGARLGVIYDHGHRRGDRVWIRANSGFRGGFVSRMQSRAGADRPGTVQLPLSACTATEGMCP